MTLTIKFVCADIILDEYTYENTPPLHIPKVGDSVFIKNKIHKIHSRHWIFENAFSQSLNYQVYTGTSLDD